MSDDVTSPPSRDITVMEPESREPSLEEAIEYAEFLGIDPKTEEHLMWIARKGVVAPVPEPWRACTENGDDVFYFNFETGESVWDHPCDETFRDMVKEYRPKGPAGQPPETQTSNGGCSELPSGNGGIGQPCQSILEQPSTSSGLTRSDDDNDKESEKPVAQADTLAAGERKPPAEELAPSERQRAKEEAAAKPAPEASAKPALAATLEAGASDAGAAGTCSHPIMLEVQSLTRSLAMMKEIREKQQEFLRLIAIPP